MSSIGTWNGWNPPAQQETFLSFCPICGGSPKLTRLSYPIRWGYSCCELESSSWTKESALEGWEEVVRYAPKKKEWVIQVKDGDEWVNYFHLHTHSARMRIRKIRRLNPGYKFRALEV